VLWVVLLDMVRVTYRYLANKPLLPLTESPHVPSRLVEDWVRD
jgi:carbon starvation protein